MNNNNDYIFDIFHEDYEGEKIKKIMETKNLDLTIDFREGKNILFALGCNLNMIDFFQSIKEHFEMLGKDIKKYLNEKDDNGNTLLNYVIINLPHILSNLESKQEFSKGDKTLIEDKCIQNIKYLVEEGCDLQTETNEKNYLEYLNSNVNIENKVVSLLDYKDYVLKLGQYFIEEGLNPYYDNKNTHLLIYGVYL